MKNEKLKKQINNSLEELIGINENQNELIKMLLNELGKEESEKPLLNDDRYPTQTQIKNFFEVIEAKFDVAFVCKYCKTDDLYHDLDSVVFHQCN